MKTIIFYTSKTGFTKRYVDSLARRIVEMEVKPLKELKKKDLKENDFIFYAGPLRNNKIVGLDKFLKNYSIFSDKEIFILATGMEPETKEKKENVIMANGLEFYHVRLYLLPSGLDINKMSKIQQFFMRKGMKYAAKQQGVSEDLLRSRLEYPLDMTDLTKLDYIFDVYQRIRIKKLGERKQDNEKNL